MSDAMKEFLGKILAIPAPDKLITVRRFDGAEVWQMIHIEVLGYLDDECEKRMSRYLR